MVDGAVVVIAQNCSSGSSMQVIYQNSNISSEIAIHLIIKVSSQNLMQLERPGRCQMKTNDLWWRRIGIEIKSNSGFHRSKHKT